MRSIVGLSLLLAASSCARGPSRLAHSDVFPTDDPAIVPSAEGMNWRGSLDAAQVDATAMERPLLIFFTGEPCDGCSTMEVEGWTDPLVQRYVRMRLIPVRVVGLDSPLARALGIERVPAVVITGPAGESPWVYYGEIPPRNMLESLMNLYAHHESH